MEKETCHTFISLFLVQGRGGMGFIPLITTNVHIFTIYTKLKSLGNFYLKSLEFPK
jgi:hypothetical protein